VGGGPPGEGLRLSSEVDSIVVAPVLSDGYLHLHIIPGEVLCA
jgi:hypothetical protein